MIHEAATSALSFTGLGLASSDDDVTVAAWLDAENTVWTRTISEGEFLEPVSHGTGGPPCLIHTPSGFTMVYASGTSLIVRNSDGETWTPPEYVHSSSGTEPFSPDLGRGHAQTPEDLYLAWCENEDMIFFSRRISGSWQPPELAHVAPTWASVRTPRVEAYTNNGYPRPRIHFELASSFGYV